MPAARPSSATARAVACAARYETFTADSANLTSPLRASGYAAGDHDDDAPFGRLRVNKGARAFVCVQTRRNCRCALRPKAMMLDAQGNLQADSTIARNGEADHREAVASPRNSVAPLLALDHILLDVDASTREQVFACVARLLGARRALPERDVVVGLAERERLAPTALGQGVAIPHARLKALTHPIAAFVRLRWAIPFEAPDGKPVSSLLVLLVPEGATDAHLVLLAQAASMFCDKSFRDRLSSCSAAAEILATFAGWRSS